MKRNQKYLEKHFPVCFVILSIIIIRCVFLSFPFERDEGLFAYFGSLILDGDIPYQTFYDNKPAGLFYFFALIMFFFGRSVEGLHLAFMLLNVFSIIIIYRIGLRIFGLLGGFASATSFALFSLIPQIGGLGVLSEHVVIFFALLGLYLVFKIIDTPSVSMSVSAGFITGLSLVVKQNGIFFISALGLILLLGIYSQKKKDIIYSLKYCVTFGLASLVPLFLLYQFFALKDLEYDMVYWTFLYSLNYIGDISLIQAWKFFKGASLSLFNGNELWWIGSILGIPILSYSIESKWTQTWILVFAIFSCIAILPRLVFHGHYFLFIVPAAALFFGVFIHFIEKFLHRRYSNKQIYFSGAIALIFLFTSHFLVQRKIYLQKNETHVMREVYGTNPFIESKRISEYLNSIKNESKSLLVFGSELQIYFYTGMKAPTKHIYMPYLIDGTEESEKRQEEFINEVLSDKPDYVIGVDHPLSLVSRPGSRPNALILYGSLTKKHYELIGVVDISHDRPSEYQLGVDLSDYKKSGDYQVYLWKFVSE